MAKRRKRRAKVAVRAVRVSKRRGRGPQKTATIGTRVDVLERQCIEIMGKPSLVVRVNALEDDHRNVLIRLERVFAQLAKLVPEKREHPVPVEVNAQNGSDGQPHDHEAVPREAA